MSSDFDEGSFPKVRGWLLAFSSIIIALWFFGADLESVSMLGTKINFTKNTEHVWLIAFVINAYLLLRFYQHQPRISYADWGIYRNCYEGLMLKSTLLLNGGFIRDKVIEQSGAYSASDLQSKTVKCVIEAREFNRYTEASEKRRYIMGMREEAVFHARCLVSDKNGGDTETTREHAVLVRFPYWLTCVCTWLSKVKIWITTTYATEYLMPYIWSGFAAVVCLVRWHATVVSVMTWCA
ncbi:hypothetical protein ABE459_16400 [Pseudomonas sp. TWI923]|uniref:hypothetical protein n=1 Tax=Pseudomonas sp. TWI923 TaxID=3136794 RepID=UPI003208C854